MPIYEFQCAKGHVTTELVSVNTDKTPCLVCLNSKHTKEHEDITAKRILSPTRTDFVFAGGRKS